MSVTVRMYNVGFGDCFLMLLPTDDGVKKVLIDCGSIKKHKKDMDQVARRVVQDVTEADGIPRIDIVVCTHRHKDHVGGFSRSVWDDVVVGEVWMPWTEHPTDPAAREIRDAQHNLALALRARLNARSGLKQYLSLAENALSNDSAMRKLHSGFKGSPARLFLPGDSKADGSINTTRLPGVDAFVLGPSKDPEIIRDMNPPEGQSYLQLMGVGTESEKGKDQQERKSPEPFKSDWDHTGVPGLSAAEKKTLGTIGDDLDQAVAVSLDSAVNGTSLMLAFRVNDRTLLFPGDAQWGTWDAAMNNPAWRTLLRETIFYKVGHHGSHNSTPVDFVEDDQGLIMDSCMVSVTPKGSWDIPRKPLLDQLEAMSEYGYVRSDASSVSEFFKREGDWYIEAEIPV